MGLVSDTHGQVRPQVAQVFAGVDLILHAGDVGGGAVLKALAAIAPVEAVFGNVDDGHDPALAAERFVELGGVTIHVSHGHELGSPTPARVLARYAADVVVFGHTHNPLVVWEGDRVAVNPGAAGPRRFNTEPSVALLKIENGAPSVQLIALATAGHEDTKARRT